MLVCLITFPVLGVRQHFILATPDDQESARIALIDEESDLRIPWHEMFFGKQLDPCQSQMVYTTYQPRMLRLESLHNLGKKIAVVDPTPHGLLHNGVCLLGYRLDGQNARALRAESSTPNASWN